MSTDAQVLRSLRDRKIAGVDMAQTKDDVVSEVDLKKQEEKKFRFHKATAAPGCVNIELLHEDTGETKTNTISIGDAVGRAVAITGTGRNWKIMQNQLISAANDAKKLEQKLRKQPVEGIPRDIRRKISKAISDELDRMRGKKQLEFKE